MLRADLAADVAELTSVRIVLNALTLENPKKGSSLRERFANALLPFSLFLADTLRHSKFAFSEVQLTTTDRKSDGHIANILVNGSKFRWAMSDDEALQYIEDRVVLGISREFPIVNRSLLKKFQKNGRQFSWQNEVDGAVLTHRVDQHGYEAKLEVDGVTFDVHKSDGYWACWQPLLGKLISKRTQIEITAKPSHPIKRGRQVGSTGPSKKTLKFVVSRGEEPKLLRRFFDGWNHNAIPTTRIRVR